METLQIKDKKFAVSIPESEIRRQVKRVAEEINRDLCGRKPLFLAILDSPLQILHTRGALLRPLCWHYYSPGALCSKVNYLYCLSYFCLFSFAAQIYCIFRNYLILWTHPNHTGGRRHGIFT